MRRDIEIPAGDVALHGWLYTPDGKSGPHPTVVANHGFTGVKEQSLDRLGEVFAGAELAALIYDHRNHGASGGAVRGHVDPWEQIHDCRHAISFAETLAMVDRDRIGVWGTSYSGAHAIVVTALDRRVKAGSSQVPMMSGLATFQRQMDTINNWYVLLETLEDERRAWARGEEPAKITVVAKDPSEPHAFAGRRSYEFFTGFAHAPWENSMTLRSLDLCLEYDPEPYADRLGSTPYQFIIAEDDISTPTDLALQTFSRIKGPKELVVVPGDHYAAYLESFDVASAAAADFFVRQLNRPMWSNRRKREVVNG